jgi:DNA mismatch repair protein MSH5
MTIKQARHPLQELLVDHYISNDVVLGSEGGNSLVKIITGQNGSGTSTLTVPHASESVADDLEMLGKSVYLKMVGLLQYMAQIGCFVPAQEGNIVASLQ